MFKNKYEQIFFSLIMSYTMAIGMEIYNTSLKMGYYNLSLIDNFVLFSALKEALFMGLVVYLVSTFIGNPLGGKLASKYFNYEQDNAYTCRLARQFFTVNIMCPLMSLIATILFNIILGGLPITNIFICFIGTFLKNIPIAFCWNFFVAAPFTHWLFRTIYKH